MTGNGKFIPPLYLWWWLGDGCLWHSFAHIAGATLHPTDICSWSELNQPATLGYPHGEETSSLLSTSEPSCWCRHPGWPVRRPQRVQNTSNWGYLEDIVGIPWGNMWIFMDITRNHMGISWEYHIMGLWWDNRAIISGIYQWASQRIKWGDFSASHVWLAGGRHNGRLWGRQCHKPPIWEWLIPPF